MALDDPASKRTDESYNRLYKKRLNSRLLPVLSVAAVAIGFAVALGSLFKNYASRNSSDRNEMIKNEITTYAKNIDYLKRIESIIKKDSIAQSHMVYIPKIDTESYQRISSRLNKLEATTKQDSSQIYDLRSSINPEKPEDVLRLARLNDKIEQLKGDIISLKDNVKTEQAQFEASINNNMSNSWAFYIAVITILAPISIKFVLQLFKDLKKD